jgi:FkbH-like protein
MNPAPDRFPPRLPESVRDAVADAIQGGSWIKVRRALSAFEQCAAEDQGPEIAVNILASFGIEGIGPALQMGLRCIPSRPVLRFGPLNTIEQELLNRDSFVYTAPASATVILWRADELLADHIHPGAPAAGSPDRQKTAQIESRIRKAVESHLEFSPAPLFVGTLPLPGSTGAPPLGSRQRPALARAIAELNAAIFGLGSLSSRVHILDANWWAAQEGRTHYDLQMDLLARQPFTVAAAVSFGFFLARNLRPLIVPRRKVLVVDLDNTLWGGVLGEDGVSQLKLGQDSPGRVFLQIQRELRDLKDQGVLLVLASKNDELSAREAFERLPEMVLHWDDFACRKINFEPKYLNLRAAAEQLGLGLDSFAFLDDSDFEREQMRTFNPEVLVINDRGHALHLLSSLLQTDAFDAHRITDEDLKRHREYELLPLRNKPAAENLEEFLSSLELQVVLEPVQPDNIDRIVQMLGKTNQFNLTTRRHGIGDLRRLASSPGSVSVALRMADRFGDQGIVGVLLAAPGGEPASLTVDSFLLSCRALGRGAEDVLWAELVARAAAAGVPRIFCQYVATPKNALVANLFDRFGLKRTKESPGATDYVLDPVRPIAFPSWIAVDRKDL